MGIGLVLSVWVLCFGKNLYEEWQGLAFCIRLVSHILLLQFRQMVNGLMFVQPVWFYTDTGLLDVLVNRSGSSVCCHCSANISRSRLCSVNSTFPSAVRGFWWLTAVESFH